MTRNCRPVWDVKWILLDISKIKLCTSLYSVVGNLEDRRILKVVSGNVFHWSCLATFVDEHQAGLSGTWFTLRVFWQDYQWRWEMPYNFMFVTIPNFRMDILFSKFEMFNRFRLQYLIFYNFQKLSSQSIIILSVCSS